MHLRRRRRSFEHVSAKAVQRQRFGALSSRMAGDARRRGSIWRTFSSRSLGHNRETLMQEGTPVLDHFVKDKQISYFEGNFLYTTREKERKRKQKKRFTRFH